MSAEPRKRSRFDQTEPEPRRSRFDRRSRSPSARQSDTRLSRSPIGRDSETPVDKKKDPAAAAAEAAARINAQLQARKGIQQVDVPPIRSATSVTPTKSPSQDASVEKELYVQDGDYIRDIEINDLRNRYTLTKGQTQKMIREETGADVTTRGDYLPDKSMATPSKPPLYLHITSQSKEGLEKAVAKIEALIKQDLPNLIDERRFRRREPEQVERDEFGRRKWPEERIPIDLEPIPGFNLRAQVVGHGGAYVKHIQQESGCRVQIKGRGSGYTERDTGQESDEPMYLHVAGPDPNQVIKAKELCEDLIANVKQQYDSFKERGPSHDRYNAHGGGGRGGYGDRGYGDRDHRDRSQSYGGNYGSHQATNSNPMSPGAPGTPNQTNPNDPYAAYGGYQNYVAYYYQWYAQQQAQGHGQDQNQSNSGAPGQDYSQQWAQYYANQGQGSHQSHYQQQGASDAPPPPPGEAAPPPPPSEAAPPPPGTGGSYSNVPPPPGL